MRLFVDETTPGVRRSHVLPVHTFDFFERRVLVVQAVGRWTSGEYARNSYRGNTYILLGRWVDTDDHMYIGNLAVD